LLPVEYELPALHYWIIPAAWIIVLLNSICLHHKFRSPNEIKEKSIISQNCKNSKKNYLSNK
jgi:hypothetical protein